MDLLYLHILNIPDNETLSGVYIVDGTTLYASTKSAENNFKLYSVISYKICNLITESDYLGKLDTYVADLHFQVIEQSGHYENGIKVVKYITDKVRYKHIKKPNNEKVEICRYKNNRHKKLF